MRTYRTLVAPQFLACAATLLPAQTPTVVSRAEALKHYVDAFNRNEDEQMAGQVPNAAAWDWMEANVPWARKYDTISCAEGHHFYEGRWLLWYNGRHGSLERIALAVHEG